MEKIRLSNGTEFMLVPMGIEKRDKLRYFKFISDSNYYDILAEFSNSDNLLIVEHVLADGTTGTTYSDCVAYKSLTFVPNVQIDDNTVLDVYMVVISTDPVERQMQSITQGLTFTELALAEVYELLLGVM